MMFRLPCFFALVFLTVSLSFGLLNDGWAADDKPERVALLVPDPASPPGTCRYADIVPALRELRFAVREATDDNDTDALTAFAELSTTAEAAMIFACNPRKRTTLPDMLQARALNFLFLLETQSAAHGAGFSHPVKTDRDDLIIIQARLDTPENEEIFARTLTHKLQRPYTVPEEILSRTVVSSYYRSRGSMVIELRGRISSKYILAKPPTDKILDAWSRVQRSTDRKALEAFIAQFPTTLFADLARSRLEKIPSGASDAD